MSERISARTAQRLIEEVAPWWPADARADLNSARWTVRNLDADNTISRERVLAELAGLESAVRREEDAVRALADLGDEIRRCAARAGRDIILDGDDRRLWFVGTDDELRQNAERAEAARACSTPLDQRVAADGAAGPFVRTVYVSCDTADKRRARVATHLIQELKHRLTTRADADYVVRSSFDLELGQRRDHVNELLTGADVVVVLLSFTWLKDKAEVARVKRVSLPRVVVRFDDILPGPRDTQWLSSRAWLGEVPYTAATASKRSNTVRDVEAELDILFSPESPFPPLTAKLREATVGKAGDAQAFIRLDAEEVTLDGSTLSGGQCEAQSVPGRHDVLGRVSEWARSDAGGSPPYCVVLGESGSGKTSIARTVTHRLLEETESGPDRRSIVEPVFFDLRAFPGRGASVSSPSKVLAALVEGLPKRIGPEEVAKVRRLLYERSHVLVVDGLDEALVRLTPAEGKRLTRSILDLVRPESSDTFRGTSKLLLTSRTQHFATIQEAIWDFDTRRGGEGSPCVVYRLLPLDDQQMRAMAARLGYHDVDEVMRLLHRSRDLTEIARTPLLLAGVLPELSSMANDSIDHYSVTDLYRQLINSWLQRDSARVDVEVSEMLRFLGDLALRLWQNNSLSWQFDDLAAAWATGPRFGADSGVSGVPSAQLKDIGSTTITVASGAERWGFAHSSFLEYFLARRLRELLCASDDDVAWSTRPPRDGSAFLASQWTGPRLSPACLVFLGEMLRHRPALEQEVAVRRMGGLTRTGLAAASEDVIAYGLLAHERGFPGPSLQSINLEHADLAGWRFGVPGRRLDMRKTVLSGVSLVDARFVDVDLTGCRFTNVDLTRTVFENCDLSEASLYGSDLSGAIFRECDLSTTDTRNAVIHRTQALHGRRPRDTSGWLLAPNRSLTHVNEVEAYAGHTAALWVGMFTRDGRHALTGGGDGVLRLWDVRTGEVIRVFGGVDGWVRAAEISPDGTLVAAAGGSGVLHVWSIDGAPVTSCAGHDGAAVCLRFSRDGRAMATGDVDGNAHIWDVRRLTRPPVRVSTGLGSIADLAWAPPGNRLLLAFRSGATAVIDSEGAHVPPDGLRLGEGAGAGQQPGPTAVRTIDISPDGQQAVTAGDDGTAVVWDLRDGRQVHRIRVSSGTVWSARYHHDGRRVLFACADGTAVVYGGTGERLTEFVAHNCPVQGGTFDPRGKRAITVGKDGTARIWDTQGGREDVRLSGHRGWVWAADWSPDGRTVVVAPGASFARIHDLESNSVTVLRGHTDRLLTVAYLPNGNVVSGSRDATVRVWDLRSGTCSVLAGHAGSILAVAGSRDGRRVVSGSTDRTARIWTVGESASDQLLPGHTDEVRAVAFSPDGSWVVTGGCDSTVRIWDTDSGTEQYILRDHTGWVQSVDVHPDGHRLVSGGSDGRIRVWDLRAGRDPVRTIPGHPGWIQSVAFDPDGDVIVTGGSDGTVRIWESESDRPRILRGHVGWVQQVRFSPDGKSVLSSGSDSTARIWDVESGREMGLRFTGLPGGELLVTRRPGCTILGASRDAWRWLGRSVTVDGAVTRIPAEVSEPFPRLHLNDPVFRTVDGRSRHVDA